MLNQNFVYLGAVLNLIGSSGYVIDTIRGKTRPNRITFFLWALAPLIAFSAEIKEGVGIQSLMTFMVGFGPLMILIASFVNRKSVWKLQPFDYICGLLSILGLVLWLLTRHGNVAITFSIMADGLAATPTIVKSWREPESESYLIFMNGALSALITILTIKAWTFAQYGFPIYIFLVCFVIYALVRFKIGPRLRKEAATAKI